MKKVLILMSFLVSICRIIVYGSEVEDYQNPMNFIIVKEITSNKMFSNKEKVIYGNNKDENNKKELKPFTLDVDISSTIVISFDREYLKENNVPLKISISGIIGGNDNRRKMEIPGYNIIGENTMYAENSINESMKLLEYILEEHKKIRFVDKNGEIDEKSKKEDIQRIIQNINLNYLNYLMSDEKIKKILNDNLNDSLNKKTVTDVIKKYITDVKNIENKENMKKSELETIENDLTDLARIGNELENEKIYKKIISSIYLEKLDLKDSTIILSESGILTGETFKLTIKNNDRELNLKFRVKDYGWHSSITDSYLFMKQKDSNNIIKPVAGVTLNSIYRPRNKLYEWIYPGLGVNVSFPLDDNNNVQITTGGIVTLFNNSIIFTCGYNLYEEKPYIGVGFSFVDTASKMLK